MNITKAHLIRAFNNVYSPHTMDDLSLNKVRRNYSDFENNPQLLSFIKEIDNKRKEDSFIGAKIAGEEILINLIECLKNEKGVHTESLLAILGSLGGQECINGIMTTLRSIISDDSPDKKRENGAAGLLDILIVETESGESFVMGDRIGNTFLSFYQTAAYGANIDMNAILNLSSEVASKIGTDDYWKTSFTEYVPESPKELIELFADKFEQSLNVYCFSPQERMIAFAVAAQKAVRQAEKIIDKQRALDIIADFGWRTSHYL